MTTRTGNSNPESEELLHMPLNDFVYCIEPTVKGPDIINISDSSSYAVQAHSVKATTETTRNLTIEKKNLQRARLILALLHCDCIDGI